MKTSATHRNKGITGALTLLLFTTTVYCCMAQGFSADSDVKAPINYTINFAPNLNFSARAIPIETINSDFSEYKPALTLHGNRLYFSRALHPGNTGGVEDKEDIWYADIDKATNSTMTPKRLEGHLNNSGPNFVSGVSVTGDTIMLGNTYDKKGKMRAGISYSVNENGTWSAPKTIHIKNDYNLSEHGNAYVSLSGGVIISAVQRTETYGQRDLYVSFWGYDHATEPVNMGSVINSNLDESSPFLSVDKKTLYFASKGHHGYGGYDIYMSRRLDDSWTNWSEPENLGPAVNGPLDEEFFSITHCKQWGYFSKQVGDQNVDIYKIPMGDLFGGSKAIFR